MGCLRTREWGPITGAMQGVFLRILLGSFSDPSRNLYGSFSHPSQPGLPGSTRGASETAPTNASSPARRAGRRPPRAAALAPASRRSSARNGRVCRLAVTFVTVNGGHFFISRRWGRDALVAWFETATWSAPTTPRKTTVEQTERHANVPSAPSRRLQTDWVSGDAAFGPALPQNRAVTPALKLVPAPAAYEGISRPKACT